MSNRPHRPGSEDAALTEAEHARLAVLLGDVSTQTLLRSLAALDRDSGDARLIIAALLERLPPGEG